MTRIAILTPAGWVAVPYRSELLAHVEVAIARNAGRRAAVLPSWSMALDWPELVEHAEAIHVAAWDGWAEVVA